MTNLQAYLDKLKPNVIVRGSLFQEPVQVITTIPMDGALKLIGAGTKRSALQKSGIRWINRGFGEDWPR